MKTKILYPALFLLCISQVGLAQVTYSGEIAKIIYENCSTCHRQGEIGPMALTSYEEVAAWSGTIEYVTSNKIMPPSQTDPEYSNFLGENFLTEDEISNISTWVADGMPRGDVADEPAFPDFPDGSVLGEPDLVLEMSEEWTHTGTGIDDYRYFVLPTNLPEDRVIKAVEFRPGNSKIVHHALLFEDTEGIAAAKDAATPEYGFSGFGSFLDGMSANILTQKQFPGFVPGQKPIRYPDGVGQVLQAGADVVVQVHYAPWPVDATDQSTINIFFMDEEEETFERELETHIMVPFQEVINANFIIPANSQPTFHGIYEVPIDVSLVNLSPHMHLLGKHWEIWLERPDGEEVNLARIPDWDFNWQGAYAFKKYMVAPAGSKIHAVASYDNTTSNPNNPSNPPQFVSWGEGTTDEMYYLPLGFVQYRQGDENIVFEDISTSSSEIEISGNIIYPLSPNPVDDFTVAGLHLERGQSLNISIYTIDGKKIRTLRKSEFYNSGEHFINFSTANMASGIYILQMEGKDFQASQKFVKP